MPQILAIAFITDRMLCRSPPTFHSISSFLLIGSEPPLFTCYHSYHFITLYTLRPPFSPTYSLSFSHSTISNSGLIIYDEIQGHFAPRAIITDYSSYFIIDRDATPAHTQLLFQDTLLTGHVFTSTISFTIFFWIRYHRFLTRRVLIVLIKNKAFHLRYTRTASSPHYRLIIALRQIIKFLDFRTSI
jgi:hypothetical protein